MESSVSIACTQNPKPDPVSSKATTTRLIPNPEDCLQSPQRSSLDINEQGNSSGYVNSDEDELSCVKEEDEHEHEQDNQDHYNRNINKNNLQHHHQDDHDDDDTLPLLYQEEVKYVSTQDNSTCYGCQRKRCQLPESTTRLANSLQDNESGLKQLIDEDLMNEGGVIPYRDTRMRWVMLIFGCVFLMGNYFCYDEPAALSYVLQAPRDHSGAGLTTLQYSQLYTIYSLPNIFLPLFGGVFLDRLGIRAGLLLFTMILTLGQLVFALGGQGNNFEMMLAGRFIFGSGAECMSVAASAIISQWFRGKELSFALGVNLSIARLGSFLNGITQPRYEQTFGLGSALFLGFEICVISLLAAFALVCIDAHADRVDSQNRELLNQQEAMRLREQAQNQDAKPSVDDEESESFKCSDLTNFSLPLWLISASCVLVYMSVFPYTQTVEAVLIDKFNLPVETAGTLYGLPYLISALICPIFGYLIDRIGKRTQFILASSLMTVLACSITIFLPVDDQDTPNYTCLIPLILLGVGYSVYASALWGSIPYIVERRALGTAFGICTALQNFGLVLAPLSVSYLVNSDAEKGHQYDQSLALLTAFAALGFLVNLWLLYDDRYNRQSILEKVQQQEQPQRDETQHQDHSANAQN